MKTWDAIADAYAARLVTRADDVHFGVGIPGNERLKLIPAVSRARALDLGCGSGENLLALQRLGYDVTGIDSSIAQLRRACRLLARERVVAGLVLGDLAQQHLPFVGPFDLLLCIGTAHFLPDANALLGQLSQVARSGSRLVLSVPHPLDMLVDFGGSGSTSVVLTGSYYPTGNVIDSAHYWRKFGGGLPVGPGFTEYLWRPSDVVTAIIGNGFRLVRMLEPQAEATGRVPCSYRDSDPWFADNVMLRIPQYMIYVAVFETGDESRKDQGQHEDS